MALSDAQVERYSRQIVLPEVGGCGQERLLAARITVAGAGAAAVTAVTLLGRAGVGAIDVPADMPALPELSPDCRVGRRAAPGEIPDLAVDLSGDRAASAALGRRMQAARRPFVLGALRGARVTVTTLVGRPCSACVAPRDGSIAAEAGPLGAPAALALGALAASEALRPLLLPGAGGRVTTLALDSGICHATEPTPTGGCPLCGGRA